MSSEGPNNRQPSIRVWALLGAHRGDNNQILALARALGLPFEETRLSYNWLRFVPPALLGTSVASLDEASRRLVGGEPPDLVIATGLRSVPVVRELKQRSGGRMRAVHLGYPRISPRHFDLVVSTPEYPVPDGPNVIRIPFALTPHRERTVEQSDRELLNAFPRPRRLLLVGGPTIYWRLTGDRMTAAVRQLLTAAETAGGSILAVGSPRTPADVLGATHATLQSSRVPFMFEFGDGPPAYPALIEAADEIFVTADSVAMVADAVTTGKPVGIVPIDKSGLGRAVMFVMDRLRPGKRLRPRDLRFFWAALRKEGFGGTLNRPSGSHPPDYLAEIAGRVRQLLGLADRPATIARDSDR